MKRSQNFFERRRSTVFVAGALALAATTVFSTAPAAAQRSESAPETRSRSSSGSSSSSRTAVSRSGSGSSRAGSTSGGSGRAYSREGGSGRSGVSSPDTVRRGRVTETGGTSAGHRDADRDRRGQGRRTGNGQSSPPRSYGHNYPYYYGDYYGYGHSYGYGGYYGYPYGYGRYSSFRLHHYPYPYYYPFGWGAYGVDARRARNAYRTGALDTDLRPEKAEIYIDGRYVGVADQFDGFPDYLWLEEGDYDVAIYADGFETISRQVRVRQGMILQLKDRMARGESIRPEQVSPLTHTPPPADELAALRLFVAPGDAAVYLDGRLVGRADEIERLDELVAGEHLLEVVRPGHRSRELAFSIESGEEAELAIELEEAAAPEGEGSETGK